MLKDLCEEKSGKVGKRKDKKKFDDDDNDD